MNKNNLDNKFGECCNCPAHSSGDQFFTNYVSSRLFNDNLRKSLKLNDSHSYRNSLQNNAITYLFNENNKYINEKCTSNNKHKFYIDTSNYNFSTQLINNYTAPSIENNYIKKSQQSNFP